MMNTKYRWFAVALSAATFMATAQDKNPPREGGRPPRREEPARGAGGSHLIPPPAMEALNLSKEQQQQLEKLENDTKSNLEKILTPEQAQQLRRMRSGRNEGPGDQRGGPRPQGGGPDDQRGGPRPQGGGPDDQRGGPRGQGVVMPIIAAIDLNKDGILDNTEIEQARQSLKKLDTNGDGKITPDEYRGQRRGGPDGPGREGAGSVRPRGEEQGRPQRPPLQ
ncbi:MAG: hypothetical protein DVB32_07285 [Verrucomicrobia bacterium]|nr:MAG: hypothetical protein DVB32_07285 [Verrucomicrobiota bacterium]